jgi:DNA polymerase-1
MTRRTFRDDTQRQGRGLRPLPEEPAVIDYAAIELSLLAQALAPGDIHADTASELFGDVTEDTRDRAKIINFRALYGHRRDKP